MANRDSPRHNPSAESVAARFADQLAGLRAAAGETQKQLAARLGMTESMISRLESGAHLPSLATLCRIADAYGRRLELVFHDHAHEHPGGVRHAHPHRHTDSIDDHDHRHERPGGDPDERLERPGGDPDQRHERPGDDPDQRLAAGGDSTAPGRWT